MNSQLKENVVALIFCEHYRQSSVIHVQLSVRLHMLIAHAGQYGMEYVLNVLSMMVHTHYIAAHGTAWCKNWVRACPCCIGNSIRMPKRWDGLDSSFRSRIPHALWQHVGELLCMLAQTRWFISSIDLQQTILDHNTKNLKPKYGLTLQSYAQYGSRTTNIASFIHQSNVWI